MSWNGVDAVDDALDATESFLFPVTLGRWARLAVVTLFSRGGGGASRLAGNGANLAAQAGNGSLPTGAGGAAAVAVVVAALATLVEGSVLPTSTPAAPLQVGPTPNIASGVAIALGVAVLVVVLAVVLLSAVFEFVLVDAIARDSVALVGDTRRHLLNGLRYLGFQIGVVAAFVVPVAAVAAGLILSETPPTMLLDRPVLIVVAAVVALAYVLSFVFVSRFTREFVIPAMVADGGGVIDGWRRVWPLLRNNLGQTLVYVVMHFLVGIGLGIVGAVLALVGLVVVATVAGVVGLAVGAVAGGTVGGDVGVGAGVLAAAVVGVPLLVVGVVLPVRVVTVTYLRAYELAALARFSEQLDLLDRYRDLGDGQSSSESDEDTDEGGTGAHGEDDGGDDDGGNGDSSDRSAGNDGDRDGDDGDRGDDDDSGDDGDGDDRADTDGDGADGEDADRSAGGDSDDTGVDDADGDDADNDVDDFGGFVPATISDDETDDDASDGADASERGN